MGNIKAVIFDFNGTMIFDSEFHRRVWYEFIPAIPAAGCHTRRLTPKSSAGITLRFSKIISENTFLTGKLRSDTRKRGGLPPPLENKERFKFVDGLYEFLDYLKEKEIPITIATGSEISNLKFYFEYFSLALV